MPRRRRRLDYEATWLYLIPARDFEMLLRMLAVHFDIGKQPWSTNLWIYLSRGPIKLQQVVTFSVSETQIYEQMD
jgi:hypothetical protein